MASAAPTLAEIRARRARHKGHRDEQVGSSGTNGGAVNSGATHPLHGPAAAPPSPAAALPSPTVKRPREDHTSGASNGGTVTGTEASTLTHVTVAFEANAPKRARLADTNNHASAPTLPLLATPTPSFSSTSTNGDAPLDVASLLNYRSVQTRVTSAHSSSLDALLSAPTLAEKLAARQFQQIWLDAAGRPVGVKQFCEHRFLHACDAARRAQPELSNGAPCEMIHLVEIIKSGITNRALGDCSYLNACSNRFCRSIHYAINPRDKQRAHEKHITRPSDPSPLADTGLVSATTAAIAPQPPPEWIRCDIRTLDVSVLGQFGVVMMDPPWRINMNLPYETMDDEEMLSMPISSLQTDGVCLVWVVTRALDLGRRCLARWGYREAGELIWAKVDQLHRLKRTGRTGHWLNHSVEHCIIGLKGNPAVNRLLDCDVIVAPTRETSRKPDEANEILERLMPNTRRLEIFGRQHNTRPGWLTLGNQLDGVQLNHEATRQRITARYGPEALTANWIGPPSPSPAGAAPAEPPQ